MGGDQCVLYVALRGAHSSYWHLPSAKAQIIKVKGSLLIHVLLVLAFPREIQLLMPTDIQGDEQAIVSPPVARLAVGTHAEQLSRHCNGTWCLLSSACDAVVDETMLT